jgi:hypothetical protein
VAGSKDNLISCQFDRLEQRRLAVFCYFCGGKVIVARSIASQLFNFYRY